MSPKQNFVSLHHTIIWRIYCMPVVFCGFTVGQLDLAEPLFYRCLFADLLQIDGGPVDRSS